MCASDLVCLSCPKTWETQRKAEGPIFQFSFVVWEVGSEPEANPVAKSSYLMSNEFKFCGKRKLRNWISSFHQFSLTYHYHDGCACSSHEADICSSSYQSIIHLVEPVKLY